MISDELKKVLADIVGEENASFSKEDAICYSYDATNTEVLPCGVVFPSTPEEISAILKLANSEKFAVVARGAGSGFTGGSLPLNGALVMSTERMNRIINIDIENMTALVEPGVINGELQNSVEDLGLFYPPDPASLKFSTIGGNIAECAGGPRALKYGVTRDYVMDLEVVLPTGEIINTGVKTMKGVVGYDLTRLMIGSEGTLGVVTSALLRLLVLPETTLTMLAVFPTLKDAGLAVGAILAKRVVPSTMEIIDKSSIECVNSEEGILLPDAGALLIIEVDGSNAQARSETEVVSEVCEAHSAIEVRVAANKREARDIWRARRSISPTLMRLKPTKLNEDVVVPRSKIVELIEGVERIAVERDVIIASFGHAGDGNIHVNIMVDGSNAQEKLRGEGAVTDLFELTLGLGGTISGEHGVGTTKAPYIGMELKPPVIDLMKSIKKVIDPNNILNPGKIFP